MVALLAQAAAVSAYLNKCVQAEIAHPVQHVSVTIHSNVEGAATLTHADLSMNRKAGRYVLSLSRANGPNRTYYLKGQTLLIYDNKLNQYLIRTLPKARSLGEALVNNLHIEPALLVSIDPPTADTTLFKGLRSAPGWQITKNSQEVTLTRRASSKNQHATNIVALATSTMLPTKLAYILDRKFDTAVYRYFSFRDEASFTPPANARQVERFPVRRNEPKFATPQAAMLAHVCEAAYNNVRWLNYRVEGSGGSETIFWHGVQAKQISPSVAWAYDGSVLTIRSGHKHVRVATIPEQVSRYLSPLGARIEPSLLALMEGDNLLRSVYTQALIARLAGAVSLNGVTYQILELKGVSLRIQVRIRQDNHLIGGFLTENLDAGGHVISSSERSISYLSVNKPFPSATFVVK